MKLQRGSRLSNRRTCEHHRHVAHPRGLASPLGEPPVQPVGMRWTLLLCRHASALRRDVGDRPVVDPALNVPATRERGVERQRPLCPVNAGAQHGWGGLDTLSPLCPHLPLFFLPASRFQSVALSQLVSSRATPNRSRESPNHMLRVGEVGVVLGGQRKAACATVTCRLFQGRAHSKSSIELRHGAGRLEKAYERGYVPLVSRCLWHPKLHGFHRGKENGPGCAP